MHNYLFIISIALIDYLFFLTYVHPLHVESFLQIGRSNLPAPHPSSLSPTFSLLKDAFVEWLTLRGAVVDVVDQWSADSPVNRSRSSKFMRISSKMFIGLPMIQPIAHKYTLEDALRKRQILCFLLFCVLYVFVFWVGELHVTIKRVSAVRDRWHVVPDF